MGEIIDEIIKADRITALTGAGMSVESGIAPFRGENGLWKKFDPQEMASVTAFEKDPERCWKLFKLQIEECLDSAPHKGHYSLVEMEEHGLNSVITQNIDGLHQKAGNEEVLELHGSLDRLICLSCGKQFETSEFQNEIVRDEIPICNCDEILKPDVVLFGEPLPENILKNAWLEAERSDLIFSLGTSAVVQPAASIPTIAKEGGATVIEINLEETPLTGRVTDHFIEGKIGEELPKLLDLL
ncbi:MAG: NAD-dependent deacylase [Candidatus Saliniplasma sp.]